MAKEIAFLYMDEKYIDTNAPLDMQVISLTGLLVFVHTYPQFRERFFRLLPDFSKGTETLDVEVHASDLFRDRPDEEHFAFYRGLVSIVNELGCRVYRRGANVPIDHEVHRQNQGIWLHFGFKSILFAVSELGDEFQIWPVMEFDQTSIQDRMFAGYIRMTDHATAYLDMIGEGVKELVDENLMVDNSYLGELHYVSKKSAVGNAVDCLAYILHCKWLNERGFPLTDYKVRLAEIASSLCPSQTDDHVVVYQEG